MAKAGAFDGLHRNRAQVFAGIEAILAMASRTSAEIEAGQDDLFGERRYRPRRCRCRSAEPGLPMERLAHEFEAVGFYLSGHPLDDYVKPLARLGVES